MRPRRSPDDLPRPSARLARLGFDIALNVRGSSGAVWRALLVHGWEADHRALGTIASALVGLGSFCVMLDLPAHGGSAGETMMIPEAADALVAVGETHGPFDLCVAHSMGAAVALVAMSRGLRPGKTAFLAPPANYVRQLSLSARAAGAPEHLVAAALDVLRSR